MNNPPNQSTQNRLPTAPASPDPVARSILVVDDSIDAAESMAMLLRLKGHAVRVAYNGADALEMVANEPPSVVLLDIGLPGLDGHEVCRRIRESGVTEARIIALTGHGLDEDRERSKAAGFDAHAVKPVALAEILKIISS